MRSVPSKWLAALLVLALGGAGCAALESPSASATGDAPPGSQAQNAGHYRFNDLPVPQGYTLVTDQSFVFESPGMRAGHLVYTGGGKNQDIVRFFRNSLPQQGWSLVSSFERGESLMTFEKPGWVAGVLIRPGTFDTRIEINIGPRAQPLVEQDIRKRK